MELERLSDCEWVKLRAVQSLVIQRARKSISRASELWDNLGSK